MKKVSARLQCREDPRTHLERDGYSGSGSCAFDAQHSVKKIDLVEISPLLFPLTIRLRLSETFSSTIRFSSLSDGIDGGLSVDSIG